MPKATKIKYYAVRYGRVPGVYATWDEAEAQVGEENVRN
jgi:viroplasmin and RNaseH domain-containing protein